MTPACSLRLPAAKAAKAEMADDRGRGGAGVRRYENRLSAEGLCAEFSAERVTSSPPESGGEPEGRGGLKKRQFYGIASISPCSCVPPVASGKAERRTPLGD